MSQLVGGYRKILLIAVIFCLLWVLTVGCKQGGDPNMQKNGGASTAKAELYEFERSYEFSETMPFNVLQSYLSRAVTHEGLCMTGSSYSIGAFEDDVRMLINIGAKFIGRAAFAWGTPPDDDLHFKVAAERAAIIHEADPDIILQACVFEAIYKTLEKIPIPEWVFLEFGLEPEDRTFDFEAMLYEDGRFKDQWGPNSAVPDMSRLETRMWFFYRAARYIDAGFEAIHFGQVHLMSQNDPGYRYWLDMLGRVRAYAKENARRKMVLCDAHTHGIVVAGKLMFDFHSYPMRPKEDVRNPEKAILEVGYLDSIYRRSKGGITPSGWSIDSLPYLVEFDNFGGAVGAVGWPDVSSHSVWGYDEVAWFAHQPEEYRNEWLQYAWDWVRKNDPIGWVQFVTRRTLGNAPVKMKLGTTDLEISATYYQANPQSKNVLNGFNQEDAIKAVWEREP